MGDNITKAAFILSAVSALFTPSVWASDASEPDAEYDSEDVMDLSENMPFKEHWAVSALQFILEKRPDILRKSSFVMNIPAGRQELSTGLNLEWEAISVSYSFAKETGNKFEIKIPSAKLASGDINFVQLKKFGVRASLKCGENALCAADAAADFEKLSVLDPLKDKTYESRGTELKIRADNLNLKYFMKEICRDGAEPDLMTFSDLADCLRHSSKAKSAAYLIGSDFSLTAKADIEVDGKVLDFSWKTDFSENKPSDNGKYVLSRSQTLAFLKVDKDFLSVLPERQIKLLTAFLENVDQNAGDRYSVKLFCRSIECNLNGKSSKDSFAPFFSAKAAAMFSEVHSMASSVKQQVELCIFDQGIENVERCSTGNSAKQFENSFGWDLSHEPQYYESKYVESVEVRNGVITAKAKKNGALKGETIIYVPKMRDNAAVEWIVDEKSTCLGVGLCQK